MSPRGTESRYVQHHHHWTVPWTVLLTRTVPGGITAPAETCDCETNDRLPIVAPEPTDERSSTAPAPTVTSSPSVNAGDVVLDPDPLPEPEPPPALEPPPELEPPELEPLLEPEPPELPLDPVP